MQRHKVQIFHFVLLNQILVWSMFLIRGWKKLEALVNPKRVLPATVEIVDIAGLVKGASNGEGLGNLFLQHV